MTGERIFIGDRLFQSLTSDLGRRAEERELRASALGTMEIAAFFRKFVLCGVAHFLCYTGDDRVDPKSAVSLAKYPLENLSVVPGVTYVDQKESNATGALIFLHGSTDQGVLFQRRIESLMKTESAFPHIRVIYPTAPAVRYSFLYGLWTPTWYDISGFTLNAVENTEQLSQIIPDLMKIIEREVRSGIPINRIAVAGFSRGGAMSYHMGYRVYKNLAGVGVLSSFLPASSLVYKATSSPSPRLPPLFQAHGVNDPMVSMSLAEVTFNKLKSRGVIGKFRKLQNTAHQVTREALKELFSFISDVIPNNKV